LTNDTIAGALPESSSPTSEQAHEGEAAADADALAQGVAEGQTFKIRGADSEGQRSSANVLIRRRYAWRGYDASSLPAEQMADRITLTATDRQMTIGTITVGLGGIDKLQSEETFGPEIEALRAAGHRICEFAKLAIDTNASSRHVLASLFHVAYLLAHRIRGYDTLIGEVNPRHVAYYRRQLGSTILGSERTNKGVNAPSVLLSLDLNYMGEQIALYGGRSSLAEKQRALYPLFFSAAEEVGILGRLHREPW
jgi:hypothetical protein